jgi:hypothetical protein
MGSAKIPEKFSGLLQQLWRRWRRKDKLSVFFALSLVVLTVGVFGSPNWHKNRFCCHFF